MVEDITLKAPGNDDPVPESKLLSEDDVDALLEAATDSRDRALIAFLTVTGQRITAAVPIRLGDVDLDARSGTITPNEDAKGLKGASGPRPLLWARPYVATWLQSHPRRGDDDAPLFCCTQSGRRPREDGGWVTREVGDALSTLQACGRLRAGADTAAGVDPDKVTPHNFRHTAITRMRDRGIDDERIKFMVGVAEGSDILERYDRADDEQKLARAENERGTRQVYETLGQQTDVATHLHGVPDARPSLPGVLHRTTDTEIERSWFVAYQSVHHPHEAAALLRSKLSPIPGEGVGRTILIA